MFTYYYDTETGKGQFVALSDERALKKMPKNTLFLYRESDNIRDPSYEIIYRKESK